jgi:uncharacterized membrane protein (DUF485 family)
MPFSHVFRRSSRVIQANTRLALQRNRQLTGRAADIVINKGTHNKRRRGVMGARTYNWSEIAQNPKYLELKRKKRVFLFGWWIAASVYYFSLPLLSGYFPAMFRIKLIGVINFGYLFILSQFLVAIFIAMYYTKVANSDFDRLTDELVREIR